MPNTSFMILATLRDIFTELEKQTELLKELKENTESDNDSKEISLSEEE